MRALVTGDVGFIGSNFSRHLREGGWDVTGFDIRGLPCIDAIDFFRKDDQHFDLAIHAAAAIPSAEDRARNPMPVATNLALDSLYFEWMMRTRPGRAVYFSSSAIYPVRLNVPGHALEEDDIDLDHIENADSMYGFTKLVGEVQVQEIHRQGQHVLVVRPQSGYGHDQSPNYPFRAILERVKRREDPLVVWGTGQQARELHPRARRGSIHHGDARGRARRPLQPRNRSGYHHAGVGRAHG